MSEVAVTRVPDVDWAVWIVARRILADTARTVEWGDYPEIGEDDWFSVIDQLDRLSNDPRGQDYEDAYVFLTERPGAHLMTADEPVEAPETMKFHVTFDLECTEEWLWENFQVRDPNLCDRDALIAALMLKARLP